jgi:hypothetical protein
MKGEKEVMGFHEPVQLQARLAIADLFLVEVKQRRLMTHYCLALG